MMPPFDIARMKEALRLTQAGRLNDASRLLQGETLSNVLANVLADVLERTPESLARTAPSAADNEKQWHSISLGQRSLRYLMVTPETVTANTPVIMMLHGCTQDPADFMCGTRMAGLAAAQGIVTLWPEQVQRANAQRCWNWFLPVHQKRGSGEPGLLMAAAADARAQSGAGGPLMVAGMSAGGAMAAVLAALYPESVSAVGIHSGLPAHSARDMPSAHIAMRQGPQQALPKVRFVPTFIMQGAADAVVSKVNADAIARQAAANYGAPLYESERRRPMNGVSALCRQSRDADGRLLIEQWSLDGAGHSWSGGDPAGSHSSSAGPDASAEMLRFFREAVAN